VFEVRGSTVFHCVMHIPEFSISHCEFCIPDVPDAIVILINRSCNVIAYVAVLFINQLTFRPEQAIPSGES
jgi:hypothetical protein